MSKKLETRKARAAKPRHAPAANGAGVDPVFGAIAEHQALSKETGRLEAAMMIARNQVEKRRGKSLKGAPLLISAAAVLPSTAAVSHAVSAPAV